jgi:hypothetical protein
MLNRFRPAFLAASAGLIAAALAAAYSFNGYHWVGSKPVVPYYISTSFAASTVPLDDAVLGIKHAADEWNEEGGANIRLVYMGLTNVNTTSADGVNDIR